MSPTTLTHPSPLSFTGHEPGEWHCPSGAEAVGRASAHHTGLQIGDCEISVTGLQAPFLILFILKPSLFI